MKALSVLAFILVSHLGLASDILETKVTGTLFNTREFLTCGLHLNYQIIEDKISLTSAREIIGKKKMVRVDNPESLLTLENREVLEKGLKFELSLKETIGGTLIFNGVSGKETISISVSTSLDGEYKIVGHEVTTKKLFGGKKLLRNCYYQ
jgi:hypothetical protein